MTTIIGKLLETFDELNEVKGAGLKERRMFFKVTSKTHDGVLATTVEAPSMSKARANALLVWSVTQDNDAPEAMHNIADARVELVSAFTPKDVPFFSPEDNDSVMSDWVFKAVKREQTKTAKRLNRYPYVLPMIPVAHPDATNSNFKMIPAYEVTDYVEKGFKVIGKSNTQRRLGNSTAPYKA